MGSNAGEAYAGVVRLGDVAQRRSVETVCPCNRSQVIDAADAVVYVLVGRVYSSKLAIKNRSSHVLEELFAKRLSGRRRRRFSRGTNEMGGFGELGRVHWRYGRWSLGRFRRRTGWRGGRNNPTHTDPDMIFDVAFVGPAVIVCKEIVSGRVQFSKANSVVRTVHDVFDDQTHVVE